MGFIVVIFLFTRLFKIGQIPGSLYWDESSIGYNAYSVLQDGRDEWNNFLPLHFRAFGEFKLPVYIYSVAVAEKFLGLGTIAIRIPSVFYSMFSLILIYFITKKLFGKNAGLFAAFIFTISPWYFIFSRAGYEATAGLFFFLLGVFFFLLTDKKNYFFLLMVLSFILSFYSYNSFRIFVPVFLIIFGLIFLCKKGAEVKTKLLWIIPAAALFLLVLVPVYRLYKYDAGFSRLDAVQISNKREIVENYFSHFSLSFLFLSGDSNPRSNIPGFGELYLVELPFLLIGAYVLIKKKSKFWWLPFLAIFLGPIPAAITKESPHALRSVLMFPFFSVVSGLGVDCFANFFKRNKEIIVFVVVLLLLLSFENYYSNFLTSYPVKYSADWQYGYMKIFTDYRTDFAKYSRIVVSDQDGQPYIFALYYLKYDPNSFRQSAVYNPVDNWGASTVKSFGKFVFKKIESSDLQKSTLVFATINDKIAGVNSVGEIKDLNGQVSFWVYSK